MNMSEIIRAPKTKFLRLKCNNCKGEQNVFSAATTDIRCVGCKAIIAESSASKTRARTKVIKVLN